MLGIFVSKFHEFVSVVENNDPLRLHAPLEQSLSESHLQNSTRHTKLLWDRTDYFNDDFGRLTWNEPLFRGVSIAVIDPFFITCDNSPDKSIIHGITDNLKIDIHSTLSQLRCQFMRYRSTASVWFSKCLYLGTYVTFWCNKFYWPPTSTIWWFSSKSLRIFSISHKLSLPECGKSLVLSLTVLKRWNHRCATLSLTTPSPSTSHILRASVAALKSTFQ